MIKAANESFLCSAPVAKVAPGNGNNNQTFSIDAAGAMAGGRLIPGITWAAWSNADGNLVDPGDGTIGVVQNTGGEDLINTQQSAGSDRNALNIDADQAGQILYSRTPGQAMAYPVISIRPDTEGNGNVMRIRGNAIPPAINNQAALNAIDVNTSPGDEVILADVGDDGLAKEFPIAGGSDTIPTSFVIEPGRTETIQRGDTINSTSPYSVTETQN